MTRARWIAAVLGVIAVLILSTAIAFLAGRGCQRGPAPVAPDVGIDASVGDRSIAAALDGSIQREEQHIRELELEHARELEDLEKAEQREYEAARARGRAELARWFSERSRRLLADGGS